MQQLHFLTNWIDIRKRNNLTTRVYFFSNILMENYQNINNVNFINYKTYYNWGRYERY
jgi:hypothetical protein